MTARPTRSIPGRFRHTTDSAQRSRIATFPHPDCTAEREGDEDAKLNIYGGDKSLLASFYGEHFAAEAQDNQLHIYAIGDDDGTLGVHTAEDRRRAAAKVIAAQDRAGIVSLNAENAKTWGRPSIDFGPIGSLADLNRANALQNKKR